MVWPLLLGAACGAAGRRGFSTVAYGSTSSLDTAALATGIGLGLAGNLVLVVRARRRNDGSLDFLPAESMNDALGEMRLAVDTVFRTPTLKYLFVGGALVSFGMNGLVGWAPTFMSRELGLSVAQGTLLLGQWGLLAGTAGTLAGGFIADWLGKFTGRGRMLVSSVGLFVGGPLAVWLLAVRDLGVFVPVFAVAFFFLTLYNGPVIAAVFDVAPARIGATVVGAYLLFIHVAGDAIALPLVGFLSDRFGIDRAIFLLPVAAIVGGRRAVPRRRDGAPGHGVRGDEDDGDRIRSAGWDAGRRGDRGGAEYVHLFFRPLPLALPYRHSDTTTPPVHRTSRRSVPDHPIGSRWPRNVRGGSGRGSARPRAAPRAPTRPASARRRSSAPPRSSAAAPAPVPRCA